jgi:hypothetical protein
MHVLGLKKILAEGQSALYIDGYRCDIQVNETQYARMQVLGLKEELAEGLIVRR